MPLPAANHHEGVSWEHGAYDATRNQSSILEADQREPLEILGISGHKGFGKSLISLLYISPISGG